MERTGATTLRGNALTVLGPELKAGDKAPEFTAIDDSLKPVTLATTGMGTVFFELVPAHLFMNFRIVDEHGRQLGMGRNLAALMAGTIR